MVTESGSPLKQTFPVPSSPLPVINLEHKEGAITGKNRQKFWVLSTFLNIEK
jgi:hypothetical protein